MPKIVRMILAEGITRFKTATISETEMAASVGAEDIFLAYQPIGPNVQRLLKLVRQYPRVRFLTLLDNFPTAEDLSRAFADESQPLQVLLDLNVGMHRTGLTPDEGAFELYQQISELSGLTPVGLHPYDGHLHQEDLTTRTAECQKAYDPVHRLKSRLEEAGFSVPLIVAGGTPTFPIHAKNSEIECSPGTCVFWDRGSQVSFPDLDFLHAALVATRIISKPTTHRICVDLGHKAIAAENPLEKRVQFINAPDAVPILQSEEHLVLESKQASSLKIGDMLYGIPWHICPTSNLYSNATVIRENRVSDTWEVTARERQLSI
jgi:D-serine deaminase-like pyridoxal phosphate-dependent protein